MSVDIVAVQKEIKDLVADGKLEKALSLLENTAEELSESKHNAAVILSSRMYTFKQNASAGVLSSNEQNLEQARLSKAILELTDQLDDKQSVITDTSRSALLIKALIGIALLTMAGFVYKWVAPKSTKAALKTKVEGQLLLPNGKAASFVVMDFQQGRAVDTTDVNGKYSVILPWPPEKTIILEVSKAGKTYFDGRIMIQNLNRKRFKLAPN